MGFRFEDDGKLIIFKWTGLETRAIREAMRLSVRQFAEHFGVSDRMVSKWEAAGGKMTPRPMNQSALDMLLEIASADVRARFEASLKAMLEPEPEPAPVIELVPVVEPEPLEIGPPQEFVPRQAKKITRPRDGNYEPPPAELWRDPRLEEVLAHRMIDEIYRYLQVVGYSQRYIARLTGQSQSEISEVLAGRRITSYDVIARIAEGLNIPRGRMGLAYADGGPTDTNALPRGQGNARPDTS